MATESWLTIARVAAVAACVLVPFQPAFAQAPPAGPELPVNTTTLDEQSSPSVAMDAAGNFAIAWVSYRDDSANADVKLRRYNADGTPRDQTEVLVNTNTTGQKSGPSVAMDDDGDFVVAWDGPGAAGFGVYARRYAANGAPKDASEVTITTAGIDPGDPSVAMDADGDFVIAWNRRDAQATLSEVYVQKFNAAGAPVATEAHVNVTTADNQTQQQVAMDDDGDFVVAWTSYNQDGNLGGVYARRYNTAGGALTGELPVNATTTGNQTLGGVAMDADGDFVVAWQGGVPSNSANPSDVFAQRFTAAGVPQGGEITVNNTTGGWQIAQGVAMDPAGNFVIPWTSDQVAGGGMLARRYSTAGVPLGNEFRVDTSGRVGEGGIAAVAANGKFAIAWVYHTDDDALLSDIRARLFTPARRTAFDVNGDGKADAGIFRPSNPQGPLWYVPWTGGGGQLQIWFGANGDTPVMADYDGDGGADATIWRPTNGLWYGVNQAGAVVVQQLWGQPGDVPVPCDYDGDGRADLVTYRPRTGTYQGPLSGGGFFNVSRGLQNDVPVYGDVNGDGTCDAGVFRAANAQGPLWYVPWTGGGGQLQIWFGANGDKPVMADYDGDGADDAVIWRPSNGLWYGVNQAGAQVVQQVWGQNGDVPVPADYDGDRRADLITYRGGTFLGPQTGGAFLNVSRGVAGDLPVDRRQP